MGTSLVGRTVAVSIRHSLIVLLGALAATAAALVYLSQNFAMTAETSQLISPKLDWRKRGIEFDKAFPQLQNLTMIVVDGATPELADDGAKRLASALQQRPDLFHNVRQPDGGRFFERNGLLLLPMDDVRSVTDALIKVQPLLSALAADPSLAGAMKMLNVTLLGIEGGDVKLKDIEPQLNALAGTFEKAVAGQPAYFSWRTLVTGDAPDLGDKRRLILVQPEMDYGQLQPGQGASDAIRAMAGLLNLDPAHGVTVRLTGQVPLADEEFASLADDAGLITAAMAAALIGILWLAVRSTRITFAIICTTLIGLVITAAIGLLAVGRFNLISVAFIPLFVGLGVDFSIQFSVRTLAERLVRPNLEAALVATGKTIGRALALSAAAIGVGFFAFLPTSYLGVAELGTIAGLGMIVAFTLTISLLPTVLLLLRAPQAGLKEVGFTLLAPVDDLVHRHRRAVLIVALLAATAAAALLPLLRFDYNPLNLKSPRVESMATLRDMQHDRNWSLDAINILAPSLADAAPLARRLADLPEVSRVVSLNSFMPENQKEKLVLIGDAVDVVEPVLDVEPAQPATDAELQQRLGATAISLRVAAEHSLDAAAAASARRLADVLDRLKTATPAVRASAAAAVVTPLKIMLDQVRTQLKARPISIETLPKELIADWMTLDARVRLLVLPKDDHSDASLRRFAQAVQSVAPDATGWPISTVASGESIVHAFLQAGTYSFLAITLLLVAVLRRVRDVVLTMLPVILSGLLTFGTCAALDLPLNFTNIIALPLLLGVGVAFNIYFVLAWRAGETAMLQSSLMRAVVFSAMTTATAFGALWLSSHPGTASMGRLLMISLAWELLVTVLFRPALLAQPATRTISATA
ncbi:MMPL family transporter [Reyranella sp.]|uniref:MMPL family transporter n=1 Tax=Reyranella sp. TaxID=1929291 RepID=UPI0011F5475D|nr:MMPL family transporter [Reyranella sp.]TAJ88660.1 MAG: hopanoid biosynthesis-associated RND transporter HpnN [Reyranella sp.]